MVYHFWIIGKSSNILFCLIVWCLDAEKNVLKRWLMRRWKCMWQAVSYLKEHNLPNDQILEFVELKSKASPNYHMSSHQLWKSQTGISDILHVNFHTIFSVKRFMHLNLDSKLISILKNSTWGTDQQCQPTPLWAWELTLVT